MGRIPPIVERVEKEEQEMKESSLLRKWIHHWIPIRIMQKREQQKADEEE